MGTHLKHYLGRTQKYDLSCYLCQSDKKVKHMIASEERRKGKTGVDLARQLRHFVNLELLDFSICGIAGRNLQHESI